MNRIKNIVLSIALQFMVIQFLTGCNAFPALAPATAIPTIAVIPAATATAVQPTNAPSPTLAPPTAPPTVRVAGLRIALLAPDNAVKIYGLDGGSALLTPSTARLNLLNFNTATNAISDTIYAGTVDAAPAPVVTVDSAGVHPVAALKNPLTGEAVAAGTAGGGHLAWGKNVISGTVATTEMFLGSPDGSQVKSIVKKSTPVAQEPRALTPFQFSKDASRLYYGLEPVGLGGYILFGGATNLWSYSLSDGKSAELIKDKQVGGFVCIDGVSPNDKLVAYHCSGKGIGVLDLATKKSSVIQLPTDLKEVKALGNARFSPDSTRIAFAAARNNPDDEQGWILVSSGLTGASKMIAKSAVKDYYELITWLNADTLLLQSHNPQPALWTVKVDGTGLQKLGDGRFLSLLPARP
jgi:hypothetical protein